MAAPATRYRSRACDRTTSDPDLKPLRFKGTTTDGRMRTCNALVEAGRLAQTQQAERQAYGYLGLSVVNSSGDPGPGERTQQAARGKSVAWHGRITVHQHPSH